MIARFFMLAIRLRRGRSGRKSGGSPSRGSRRSAGRIRMTMAPFGLNSCTAASSSVSTMFCRPMSIVSRTLQPLRGARSWPRYAHDFLARCGRARCSGSRRARAGSCPCALDTLDADVLEVHETDHVTEHRAVRINPDGILLEIDAAQALRRELSAADASATASGTRFFTTMYCLPLRSFSSMSARPDLQRPARSPRRASTIADQRTIRHDGPYRLVVARISPWTRRAPRVGGDHLPAMAFAACRRISPCLAT